MACKAPEFPRRLLYTRQHRTDPSLVVSQQTSTDSGASLSHFFNDAGVVGDSMCLAHRCFLCACLLLWHPCLSALIHTGRRHLMDSFVTLTLDRIIFLLHSFASRTLSADYVSVCGVRLWTTRSQVCFPAEKKRKEMSQCGWAFGSILRHQNRKNRS